MVVRKAVSEAVVHKRDSTGCSHRWSTRPQARKHRRRRGSHPPNPELSEQLFYRVGCVEDFSRRERSGAFLQRARSPLKMISSKAAGILNAEAYLMGHSPLVQIGAT